MSFRRAVVSIAVAASCLLPSAAFGQPEGAGPAKPLGEIIPPSPIHHPEPPYPPSELDNPREVTVVLGITIGADGSVSNPVVRQSGGELFDKVAIETVRTWSFVPAEKAGKPFAVTMRAVLHFHPPPPEVKPPPKPTPPPAPAPQPGPPAVAAPGAPPAAAAPAPMEVNVRGVSQAPSRGASDFVIAPGELARVPRKNATEMLTLAPGILLTNEGGEGHAEQVFLRGFDAREGQDLEFTVGGVPINESGNLHGNGYADTHFIIPELVESLRVLEGPFDPRQGNYAVAGSADYQLGLTQRGLTAKLTVGQFNTQRMLLLWGPKDESPRTFAGAEIYRTDGFGQNRGAKRASAMGQYEGNIGSKGSFRVTAQAYIDDYHSAGVVREDDYEAGRVGFYGTYDPNQGGNSSRYSVAGDVERKSGDTLFKQQVFVIYRSMRLLENFTGFLLDVQTPLQSPHGQRGDLLDLDMTEVTVGARGSARLTKEVFGHKQELEFGYFARGDHVDGTQQRLEAANMHPYKTEADLTSKIGDIGLYADAGLRPLSWLTLRGGLRADLLAYDVLDNCAVQSVAHPSPANPPGDSSCLSQENMGQYREPVQRSTTSSIAMLPRGSIILGPFKGFNFNLSVGRGVRSVDPSYITQDVPSPFASVLAYEGGVAYAHGLGPVSLVVKSVLFQTRVDKDLIFSETAGRNILGGATTRTGWTAAVRVGGDHFDVNTNATLVKSTFDDTGLLVPYVPDLVVRADGALFGDFPWKVLDESFRGALAAGFTYVGHRPLPYGQRSDVIATFDASATLGWSHYEVGVSAQNLFNEQYRLGEFNYASDFHTQPAPTLVPMRHFTAGAPRTILATFGVNFGGL